MEQALGLLKIRRRRFFDVLKIYRGKPEAFSLDYQRGRPGNQIDRRTEQKIVKELKKEKDLIEDKNNPVQFYNYRYLKNVLEKKYGVNVALSTIIRLDDIFCCRFKKIIDSYRRISFNNLSFSIHGVSIREEVELQISFNPKTKMALIRFWYRSKLVGQQEVKTEDLKKVQF